eukprot:5848279-Pyramimonas_sp.AAC.1
MVGHRRVRGVRRGDGARHGGQQSGCRRPDRPPRCSCCYMDQERSVQDETGAFEHGQHLRCLL